MYEDVSDSAPESESEAGNSEEEEEDVEEDSDDDGQTIQKKSNSIALVSEGFQTQK